MLLLHQLCIVHKLDEGLVHIKPRAILTDTSFSGPDMHQVHVASPHRSHSKLGKWYGGSYSDSGSLVGLLASREHRQPCSQEIYLDPTPSRGSLGKHLWNNVCKSDSIRVRSLSLYGRRITVAYDADTEGWGQPL